MMLIFLTGGMASASIPWWAWIVYGMILFTPIVIGVVFAVLGIGKLKDKTRKKKLNIICPQCGKTLDVNKKFCTECGAEIKEGE